MLTSSKLGGSGSGSASASASGSANKITRMSAVYGISGREAFAVQGGRS